MISLTAEQWVRSGKQERGSTNVKKDPTAVREELYINFVIKVPESLKWMAEFKGTMVHGPWGQDQDMIFGYGTIFKRSMMTMTKGQFCS